MLFPSLAHTRFPHIRWITDSEIMTENGAKLLFLLIALTPSASPSLVREEETEGEVREGERVEGDQEKLFQVVADIDQETVLREMRDDHGGVSDY